LVVEHAVEGCVIHILAYGITGSVRGVNLDDYRPDMIIIDDCMNDENTATREQRTKVEDLILGALKESLSPETETPDAKMVLLNTPQDFEDVAQRALKDPQFESIVQGCWTKETENLPTEYQESSWPARYPSETLRKEKRAAIARNKYSIFAREKEVKLVTAENSAFKPEWIKFYGEGEVEPEPPLHEMWVEIAVDPVPPPTQKALEKGDFKTDFEAISAVGRWRNKYYVLETMYNRGHEPNWTVVAIQDMATRWRAKLITVEAVAYQVTLAWLLRQAMRTSGRYWPIHEFKDRRKKYDRIVDGISGPLSNGQLFFRKDQTTLISQVQHYPGKNPSGTYDDVIESVAVALASLQNGFVGDGADENGMVNEDGYESLGSYRGAP
jgi:predicted phage terminase large subunit-like protein